ncbi:MAG: hypothetical protein ACRENN_01630 [Candidatus Eiseniibacteriota bacterium]
MRSVRLALLAVSLLLIASAAQAQYGASSDRRLELGINGGYAWTWARQVYVGASTGEVDIKDTGYWGLTLDIHVRPEKQVELLYRRQDSQLTFQAPFLGRQTLADVAVEYWQIGGLGGVPRGDVMPYGLFTVGATHFIPKSSPYGDEWRFSMIFGLGVKKNVGEKLGFRVQTQLPFTWVDGGGSITCGGGGCITTVGGSGIGQIDVGGGLYYRL